MALLSLKQLLRGVFVIAAPPTMGVGTSEEYWRTSVIYPFICFRFCKNLALISRRIEFCFLQKILDVHGLDVFLYISTTLEEISLDIA